MQVVKNLFKRCHVSTCFEKKLYKVHCLSYKVFCSEVETYVSAPLRNILKLLLTT